MCRSLTSLCSYQLSSGKLQKIYSPIDAIKLQCKVVMSSCHKGGILFQTKLGQYGNETPVQDEIHTSTIA